MDRTFLLLSSLLGFLGVACGAFGAHALRDRLEPAMLSAYQTGVLYHLIHALALAAVALALGRWPGTATTTAGWLFLAGIVLFSGSLYVMALTGITRLGIVTPFGGLCFLGGWAALAIAAWRA